MRIRKTEVPTDTFFTEDPAALRAVADHLWNQSDGGVVEGFRWALLGIGQSPGPIVLVSSSMAIALRFSGAYFFRRMEKILADVV